MSYLPKHNLTDITISRKKCIFSVQLIQAISCLRQSPVSEGTTTFNRFKTLKTNDKAIRGQRTQSRDGRLLGPGRTSTDIAIFSCSLHGRSGTRDARARTRKRQLPPECKVLSRRDKSIAAEWNFQINNRENMKSVIGGADACGEINRAYFT